MAFFDKLNDFAKNIGDKTNDAIETNRLNSKINAENAAAAEELQKIGQFYYGRFAEAGEDADTAAAAVAPEVLEFCLNAKTHYEAAAQARAEIDRIKAENEAEKEAEKAMAEAAAPTAEAPEAPAGGITCTSCGEVNGEGTKFCQTCGNKLEVPPPVSAGNICPNCSTANDEGMKFCKECGTRLEAPAPAEPAKRFCTGCGTEVGSDIKFCPQCGKKME